MDNEKVWDKITRIIKDQVSPANFRTWFSQARLGSLEEGRIKILVPSAFIQGQVALRYNDLIKQSASSVLNQPVEVEYVVDGSMHAPAQSENELVLEPSQPTNQPPSILIPRYSMENFVVGMTNNLAYAAAQAVIQNPGISYNPLFIYGPSGVGKTHLMQAIGNALLKHTADLKIVYAPSEMFMNDLVYAIQTKNTLGLRKKYRNCQLLMIDDIQFISGKDSTQEEFFHTFNELQAKNAQIVLTSDRPPSEITKLESRLSSRFQGGLMVDIQLPDFDTRTAILKAKLKERGESLPEQYLQMIAESVPSNTRELEGKLIQVLQAAKLNNFSLNDDLIQRLFSKTTPTKPMVWDSKKVIEAINRYFSIKIEDLIGPRRQKELVLPRQIAMYLMYENCKVPYQQIGEVLGGRDHTTIMHGVDKIKQSASRDTETQRILKEIRNILSTT